MRIQRRKHTNLQGGAANALLAPCLVLTMGTESRATTLFTGILHTAVRADACASTLLADRLLTTVWTDA